MPNSIVVRLAKPAHHLSKLICLGGLLLGSLSTAVGHAQEIEVVALTGDTIPTEGEIDDVRDATTSAGVVIFTADLAPGAIYKDSLLEYRDGVLSVLVAEPYTLPSEGVDLIRLHSAGWTPPSVTPATDSLFLADWEPTSGSGGGDGLFLRRSNSGAVASVMLDGDPLPDGNGQMAIGNGSHPAVAGNDQVAFWAEVYNVVGGFGNGSGIFRSSGTGALTQIVRQGQVPPLGTSFFDGLSAPSVNSSGEVAFVGWLDSGPVGIYQGSGGALTTIALEGQEAAPGWEMRWLDPVGGVPINEDGVVAFRAIIDDPNVDAIVLGDGSSLSMIAYGGQIPDQGQPGELSYNFSRNVALNNGGQVAFMGTHSNAFTGIFRAEEDHVVAIAREDGPVPGTASGTFTHIWNLPFALNDRGDVAFEAWFQTGGVGNSGIFLYSDETGLLPAVVQEGTPLAGGIVDSFTLIGVTPSDFRAGEPTGLDEDGRVAFRFRLTNGNEGIGIFSPPPPLFEDGFESGDTSAWSSTVP